MDAVCQRITKCFVVSLPLRTHQQCAQLAVCDDGDSDLGDCGRGDMVAAGEAQDHLHAAAVHRALPARAALLQSGEAHHVCLELRRESVLCVCARVWVWICDLCVEWSAWTEPHICRQDATLRDPKVQHF